jgi:uncharacterized membrane protein YjjP (DUF1212 family)
MKSKYLSLVLEIIWIAVGIITLAAGINVLFTGAWKTSVIFFVMAIVSFGFARYRYLQQKKL